jgi:HEXXH motif-containing protein
MVDRYVYKLKADLEEVAWQASYIDVNRAQEFISAYELLSEGAQIHFLLSPAVYEAVTRFKSLPGAERLERFVTLMKDEASITAGTAIPAERDVSEIWSPMGDTAIRRAEEGWSKSQATRLDSFVVVDFDSPYALNVLPKSPTMCRPPEEFLTPEREATESKLAAALHYVDSVSPTMGHMIRNYTRTVRCRKVDGDSKISSEHVTSTIGEIRLLNPQKDLYGERKLAEALVHESTHNLLSTYEYLNQPFVLVDDDKQYRPVSPWTGNPIPVPSFCHAAFVWYALFHFSRRELERPGLTDDERIEIQTRRNHYASGFMAPTKLSDCLTDLGVFQSAVLPGIDKLQGVVRQIMGDERVRSRAVAEAVPA